MSGDAVLLRGGSGAAHAADPAPGGGWVLLCAPGRTVAEQEAMRTALPVSCRTCVARRRRAAAAA